MKFLDERGMHQYHKISFYRINKKDDKELINAIDYIRLSSNGI
jgi:hypothetical protein